MKHRSYTLLLLGVILLLTGCIGMESAPTPTATATTSPPTATPAATATAVMPTATVEVEGDLRPLDPADCNDLANAMAQRTGLGTETLDVPITMSWSEQTGLGCQTTAIGNGTQFANIIVAEDMMKALLQERGWVEQTQAPLCLGHGGWGPGATTSCFTQDEQICEAFAFVEPSDPDLCSDDAPIGTCLETLEPEQKVFTLQLTCARGYLPMGGGPALPKTEPMRITFAPGATSARIQDSLAPGGLLPYVLNAMEGQEMTVKLSATSDGAAVTDGAILVIWGLDGTVLISDHAGASTWTGVLPLTQDYYIDVSSVSDMHLDITLDVSIPPVADAPTATGLPREIPPEFETIMQSLVPTGVPPMLPPSFPRGEGLPAIHPHVITLDTGEYELSLDYGAECQGAGACHYGSLTGRLVDGDVPVGTTTMPFDAAQAQPVTLANDIPGYFVASVCEANCSDANVFWLSNGAQYMVGMKAGAQEDVIALANAAILNFVP